MRFEAATEKTLFFNFESGCNNEFCQVGFYFYGGFQLQGIGLQRLRRSRALIAEVEISISDLLHMPADTCLPLEIRIDQAPESPDSGLNFLSFAKGEVNISLRVHPFLQQLLPVPPDAHIDLQKAQRS